MKPRSFQIRFLLSLTFWLGVSLVCSASIGAQTRAIQPVHIETKTPQNEDISYIYAESHALVIGVSKYTNGWRDLPGVEDDLRQVSQALEDNGFVVHPVRNPTKDQLKDAIEDFVYRFGAQPDNRVLIYYAGHGHTVELAGERQMGYLVPADAPEPSRDRLAFRRQALSMREIEVFAKEIIAKHALFMFDACFAGSVFETVHAVPKHIQRRTREPVRYFITSGSANQKVPDNSIFRQAFLEALRGEVDSDRDGYFTGSELGDYIYRRTVESIPNLDPQYGKLQDQNLNQGDFVFEIHEPRQALANVQAPSRDIAAQAWGMIEQSEDPAIFQTFIEKFPDAPQRKLAELKLMMFSLSNAEPKDNSLPENKPSGTTNLYDSKTDQATLKGSGNLEIINLYDSKTDQATLKGSGNLETVQNLEVYQKIQQANAKVVGCGFFHVGCSEKPLTFPAYQANFHIKGYRRVYLWGKDRPWTDTGLLVNKGDLVYFYGTGEVTFCYSNCREPQQLDRGTISYEIGNNQPQSLSRFTKMHLRGGGFQSSVRASTSGFLTMAIHDGNLATAGDKNYDNNYGFYVLDVFVIDPEQKGGFIRFKHALFRANSADSNVKAYLGW